MSDLVDPQDIEAIVGVKRHPTDHYGRAVSAEEQVYVLHSAACKVSTPDLRDCPYSIALDRGITANGTWNSWRRLLDRPVVLHIRYDGTLVPDLVVHAGDLDAPGGAS
ncbi:hypothetical protein [Isoptericola aurantiacus]|uniref:hypothetical protein n=1 Tax=Isoptericola aurantiacus TaxID=3377839 RepID=UPI00383A17E1